MRRRRSSGSRNRGRKRPKSSKIQVLARRIGISIRELSASLRADGINPREVESLDAETIESIVLEYGGDNKEVEGEAEEEQIKILEGVPIEEGITVAQLSEKLGARPSILIKILMKAGIMASVNQPLDYKTLEIISQQFGFEAKKKPSLEEMLLTEEPDDPEKLVHRPPVVTIMGHVDHGKTSLLDSIRDTNVIASEHGGITQHIGAYHVQLQGGSVVFLDTPGHEAFTQMRARGAQVTDVVVLVVGADDGVQNQTVEAINHAKAAEVPILIAINKIDLPDANPDSAKRQLSEHGLVPDEWGGQNIFVEISAKERTGIDFLLDMLLLQSELLELKANPAREARGTVIEAKIDRGRGTVATVLVQNGTLEVGDIFIAGFYDGKVRAMINDRGEYVKEAGPSTPVEVLGFTGVPEAGDKFYVLGDEKQVKALSDYRLNLFREEHMVRPIRITLEDLHLKIQEGETSELNIIIKGDVRGSIEALSESLQELSTDEVKLNVIHQAVGSITETDVLLASASNAIIIGFSVRPTAEAMTAAKREGVDYRTYNIIYDVIADVRAAMEGLLEPEIREIVIGRAEVRDIFNVPRLKQVAGCYITTGRMVRGQFLRVIRNNREIHSGTIDSLRRVKDDVTEIQAGYECGIGIASFSEFEIGDILECYTQEKVARRLT